MSGIDGHVHRQQSGGTLCQHHDVVQFVVGYPLASAHLIFDEGYHGIASAKGEGTYLGEDAEELHQSHMRKGRRGGRHVEDNWAGFPFIVPSTRKNHAMFHFFCTFAIQNITFVHMNHTMQDCDNQRARQIYRVTLWGSLVNVVLLAFKFVAGILGHSSAMVADAVHSLSDFVTDIVVLLFVRLGNRPADEDHAYGHGKYETFATLIIAVALLVVGTMLMYGGVEKIVRFAKGENLPQPGWIALVAAVVSILLKELTYQFTACVGRKVQSDTVVANAWHHRSDAFSSIGTGVGIAGAILLGQRWTVLDPVAGCVVSLFVLGVALKLAWGALKELMEHSLSPEVEERIRAIVAQDSSVSELHHLRTRKVGSQYAIEMHVRMPGNISLYEAHHHSMLLEQSLKEAFGAGTHVGIHVEPTKQNGAYVPPEATV